VKHPTSVGKYDIEEFLGGGMSHVYRARDRVLGRTVAVKILTPEGCNDDDVRSRFLLEAKMAGNICHDNVISIYDFGEDDGKPFLVMEFLRGDTLRALIREQRAGGVREKLLIALQLGRALECIHKQDIVHRDIKPENVHVGAQGVVKLMDFGIAKARGFNMTQAGFIVGTPNYMAPEQVRGEEITPKTDVYSFGVLTYELLTGQLPYKADSTQRIFYCIVSEPPDAAALQEAGVPANVQDLVLRCLRKKPEERPSGFAEVGASIAQMLGQRSAPVPVAPAGTQHRGQTLETEALAYPAVTLNTTAIGGGVAANRRRLRWWMGGVIAAVLAIGAAVAFVMSGPRLPPKISTPTGEMVLVPAGDFLYGENRKRIHLPAYYIDKTEVSNAAYSAYCAETGCTPPAAQRDLPVTQVTIYQARDFARWAHKRLPTDTEWEKAARGTNGRQFPWGDSPDITRANLNSDFPVGVNRFEDGASPYGALQMAGNVLEMVDTPRPPTPEAILKFPKMNPPATSNEPWVTVRGGSFRSKSITDATTWGWGEIPARYSSGVIGFRCVKDATQ
jgi:serine/threonine-protein kinase